MSALFCYVGVGYSRYQQVQVSDICAELQELENSPTTLTSKRETWAKFGILLPL